MHRALGAVSLALIMVAASSSHAVAQPRVRATGTVASIDFSLDGRWMAVGQNLDGKGVVSLYSAKYRSRPPVVLPALAGALQFVGFVDGGELVAAADDSGVVVVWRVPSGREVYRVNAAKRVGAGATLSALANPAAPYIGWLAIAKGKTEGRLEVARVPGGQIVTALSKLSRGQQARWSRQGDHVLVAGTAYNWDSLEQWKPKLAGVSAISPDGGQVVTTSPTACDGFLTIAEVSTTKVLRSIPIGKRACPRWLWFTKRGLVWIGPTDAAITGDAAREGTNGPELAVFSWDKKRDRQRKVKRVKLDLTVVAMSADRKYLAVSDGLAVRYIFLR